MTTSQIQKTTINSDASIFKIAYCFIITVQSIAKMNIFHSAALNQIHSFNTGPLKHTTPLKEQPCLFSPFLYSQFSNKNKQPQTCHSICKLLGTLLKLCCFELLMVQPLKQAAYVPNAVVIEGGFASRVLIS